MTPFIIDRKATMLYITAMDLSAIGDFDAKHGEDDLEAAVVFMSLGQYHVLVTYR